MSEFELFTLFGNHPKKIREDEIIVNVKENVVPKAYYWDSDLKKKWLAVSFI